MVSEADRTWRTKAKPRRGLVLGCGGTLGTAWSVAMLFEVSRALAWDPRTADVIVGTSGGSGLAMLLGAGVSVETLLDAQLGVPSARASHPALVTHFASPPPGVPRLPWGKPASLALFARAALPSRRAHLFTAGSGLLPEGRGDTAFLDALCDAHVPRGPNAWVPHSGTRIVAIDFATGARVAFGARSAPRASMRDAVRASWAIPGWFPTVTIGGRRYADGGIVSPASVDLAAEEGVDEIVVIAPMSSTAPGPRRGFGRIEGLLRGAMTRTLTAEISGVRARGLRVLRLEPLAEDLEALGPSLMDGSRRLGALESSLRTSRRNVRAALSREEWDSADTLVRGADEGARAWQA